MLTEEENERAIGIARQTQRESGTATVQYPSMKCVCFTVTCTLFSHKSMLVYRTRQYKWV